MFLSFINGGMFSEQGAYEPYTLVGPPSQDWCDPPSCTTPGEPTIYSQKIAKKYKRQKMMYQKSNLKIILVYKGRKIQI